MTSLFRALAAGLLIAASLPVAAMAQDIEASATLSSQTPWNTPKNTDLDLRIEVTNDGNDPLEDTALRLTIYSELGSRSDLHQSLDEDVGVPIAPVSVQPQRESVPAGGSREYRAELDTGFLERRAPEARIYPLKVELLAGGETVDELRTPVIFVPKEPKVPLEFAWTFVITHPISFGPDQVFVGRELERQIAAGGPLDSAVRSLRRITAGSSGTPVDVVLGPTLLLQLGFMQDGYDVRTADGVQSVSPDEGGSADATRMLAALRDLGDNRGVELSAMPYSSPNLARLLASRLGKDLPVQIARGREAVASVAEPNPAVLRPPGSVVDPAVLGRIRAQGVTTVLLDPGAAGIEPPPQRKGFAPPATLSLNVQKTSVTSILPDEDAQALLERAKDDPHLAAQIVLGDLAAVWLEEPDEVRGFAMIMSEAGESLPPSFYGAFTRLVAAAPWLRTRTATGLVKRVRPVEPQRFDPPRVSPFPPDYLKSIREDRALIAVLREILLNPETDPLPGQLESRILISENDSLVESGKLGLRWLAFVRDRVTAELAKIRPEGSQVVTLTSRTGRIPVRVTNDSERAVRIGVRLVSTRLGEVAGNPRQVTLQPSETATLAFDIEVRTTGTFPVQVLIETPSGRPINEGSLVVRSTAFSRVALFITLGAILVLLGLWGRRFVSRTKKS
ncbi:MAG: DUF6049 family protein [Actinomycetota bacterium]